MFSKAILKRASLGAILHTACFLLLFSCEKEKEAPGSLQREEAIDPNAQSRASEKNEVQDGQADPKQAIDPMQGPLLNPYIAAPTPPLPGLPIAGIALIGGGGGGGGRSRAPRLPCEKGTSDCNDKNPCTLDSCDSFDQCQHSLDTSKGDPGSCEMDGKSCTIGKCVEAGATIMCFEQRREFFAGDIGCDDSNQCTSDSCIESNAENKGDPKYDVMGNRILSSAPTCVQEVFNGSPCILSTRCAIGICMPTGTGMPGDEFVVQCSDEFAESSPQLACQETDADPCTVAACEDGVGCVIADAQDGTPCDDDDICTGTAASPDSCQMGTCASGASILCNDNNSCTSDSCDKDAGCVFSSLNGNACSDGNACTQGETCQDGSCAPPPDLAQGMLMCEDEVCHEGYCDIAYGCKQRPLTGPYGEPCVTGYEFGICALGYLRCENGSETAMCEPIFRPGDRREDCLEPNFQDDDCDGVVDDCDCPKATGTVRYVSENGADTGDCSLAACATIDYAISEASAGDTIFIMPGTYDENSILVGKDLLILGESPLTTVVDAEGNAEVFEIDNADVTICGITITGGSALDIFSATRGGADIIRVISNDGGGIFIDAGSTARIISCIIEDNAAESNGGGIYSEGALEILSSALRGNAADVGGGVFASSSAEIRYSTISENHCDSKGAGIASVGVDADLIVTNSVVENNIVIGSQTGIGLYLSAGSAKITRTTIDGNMGQGSPAILNEGSTVEIASSTISNNSATDGSGAVHNASGTIDISNSTLSGNSLSGANLGAAIFNGGGAIEVLNSTITDNEPMDAGGCSVWADASSAITFKYGIAASQRTGSDCASGAMGAILSDGFNIESAQSCGFSNANDQQDTDPMLGPLQNNGGPTKTHALAQGSPALDTSDADCGVSQDQRGYPRPSPGPGNCDIGAFEHQPTDPLFNDMR